MQIKRLFSKLFTPVSWTIFMELLFCLPSFALPESGAFDEIPHLDKVVHVTLFATFVGVWCFYLYCKKISTKRLKTLFFSVFLIAAVNGILIEYIQLNFIEGRSFDIGDILADVIGASLSYGICNIKLLKINE
jgi:hypothetical protein